MPDRLIRLPCGNWVDPGRVTSVVAMPDVELYGGGFVASRVLVSTADGRVFVREYPDLDAARQARDAVASAVNREGGPPC